jgi:hypothetical protein
MSAVPKLPVRVLYHRGALGELDALASRELGLAEGSEIEVHVEGGKLILERAAPDEHRRKVAEALDRAMEEHRGVFAALAK